MSGRRSLRLARIRRGHCATSTQPTHEELREENLRLQSQVAALTEINAVLREELLGSGFLLAAGNERLTPSTVVDLYKVRDAQKWDTEFGWPVNVDLQNELRPSDPTFPCTYRGTLNVTEAHTVMQEHLECPTDPQRCPVRVTARDTLRSAGHLKAPAVAV